MRARRLLLEPGSRCWRVATASRAAVLVDIQAYFDAAVEAMTKARRSIHFLNWAFEHETRMRPAAEGTGNGGPGDGGPGGEDIAGFLRRLADERPALDIRVLCWQSALPVAATQQFFPMEDRAAFAGSRVKFVLDGHLPIAAAHHQKVLVIDDSLAFCGSADIGQDRWDTVRHLDDDPRRRVTPTSGQCYTSRHEVMALVDGAAAAALGELFRRRWRRCGAETLASPSPDPSPGPSPEPSPELSDLWPASVPVGFREVRVGLSRTEAAWRDDPEVRECETLHLAAIAAAKHCIYMENQYFTSELMARALARRLAEADGPDVVLISTGRSPSYFDHATMDPTRSNFIAALKAADRHGRLGIYSPVTTLGRDIIVHAKLTIIDDRLVRVASANLNNRSFGFDTECDLSLEADEATGSDARAAIAGLRTGLLAHWLGCDTALVEQAITDYRGVRGAVEALRDAGHCRLRPIPTLRLNPAMALIARHHIGDPMGPGDSFRPWKRRPALARRIQAAGLDG